MKNFILLGVLFLYITSQNDFLEVKLFIPKQNKTIDEFSVISDNRSTPLSPLFNLTKILSSDCSCRFDNNIYYESPLKNYSNFSIVLPSSSSKEITNIKLYTNNKKYPSFYSLNKSDNNILNISIVTMCSSMSKSQNNNFIPSKYMRFNTTNEEYTNSKDYTMLNFTFEYNKKNYAFEYIKFCRTESINLSIFSCGILFLITLMYIYLSTSMQIDFKIIREINKTTEVKWWYGIIFVLIGSSFLLLIYFFLNYIIYIYTALCFIQCLLCMYFTNKYFIKNSLYYLIRDIAKKKFLCKFKLHHYISFILSLVIVYYYFKSKHWILNNIVAFGLVFTILSIFLFKNFIVCFIFLFCIFLYDTFWVFFSDKIFSDNVMVQAATSVNLPIKIEMPLLFSTNPIKNCMLLGLGDIALPGVVMKYCKRFDLLNSKRNKRSRYYIFSIFLYIISVSLAMIVMFFFEHGQPVLFYISPIFICGLIGKALINKEVLDFWNGLKEEEEEEQEKEKNKEEDKRNESENGGFKKVEMLEQKKEEKLDKE